MTQGETLFYLREIHSHWCASNVSSTKLAELQAAKLIEINEVPVPAVRLTSEGARIKALGRRSAPSTASSISLSRKTNGGGRYRQRKQTTRARPLV